MVLIAKQKIADLDDVLISVRAPVGPTNLSPSKACIGRGLAAIRPRDGMPAKYLLYALRASVRELADKATGSTFEAVSGTTLRAHQIPVAPLDEQRRIVAEIEKQFTRLDAGVAALQRVQRKLKRYRASVLKAACEGRLVPTEADLARVEAASRRLDQCGKMPHPLPAYESAEVLLGRILTERRAKWNGRGKYSEPAPPSTLDLPELPEGWVWASVVQISAVIVDCPHSTAKFVADGYPCVDTTCIKPGRIVREKLRFVSEETFNARVQRLLPTANDIIFAREGTVGTAVQVPADMKPCLGQRVMLMRSDACVIPAYFQHCLNSDIVRQQYLPKIVGSTAPHINVAEVKLLAIPLPPLAEQERIVAEVERRLSVVEELESTVTANLQRAARLRQAILRMAFGTLERKL